jgi:hypothetical protein
MLILWLWSIAGIVLCLLLWLGIMFAVQCHLTAALHSCMLAWLASQEPSLLANRFIWQWACLPPSSMQFVRWWTGLCLYWALEWMVGCISTPQTRHWWCARLCTCVRACWLCHPKSGAFLKPQQIPSCFACSSWYAKPYTGSLPAILMTPYCGGSLSLHKSPLDSGGLLSTCSIVAAQLHMLL